MSIELDGSVLEGGGQILRIGLALACILRRPVSVINIRANRSNRGLALQHLKVIEVLQKLTDANIKGAELRSTKVVFVPGKIRSDTVHVNIGSAGSISLLLQAAIPVALFGPGITKLHIIGGTNVEFAPHFEYLRDVFYNNLAKFGASFDVTLARRGYYPSGDGLVHVSVNPIKQLQSAFITDFGEPTGINAEIFVSKTLPVRITNELRKGFRLYLKNSGMTESVPINADTKKEYSQSTYDRCSAINAHCTTSTGCVIGSGQFGSQAQMSELTGECVAKDLLNMMKKKSCVDQYMQDQLLIYMALAPGKSKIKTHTITKHTNTAIYTIGRMMNTEFVITYNQSEGYYLIECTGIGFSSEY